MGSSFLILLRKPDLIALQAWISQEIPEKGRVVSIEYELGIIGVGLWILKKSNCLFGQLWMEACIELVYE